MEEGLLRTLRRLGHDEAGVVAVIVALFMVIMLVLVALVVDLGGLYDHDRELQAAADAAALAGVQEIIYSKGNVAAVDAKTREYVARNAAQSSVDPANLAPWSPVIDERSVMVDLRENHIPYSFAQVIGRSEGSVTAHAKAELAYLTGIDGLFPIAFSWLTPHHFTIRYGSGGGSISYTLSNGALGTEADQGIYSGSRLNASFSLGPGLHDVTVMTKDAGNNDLIAPFVAGSLYVPSATSIIRRVNVDRQISVPSGNPTANLTETVTIGLRVTVGAPPAGIPDTTTSLPVEVIDADGDSRTVNLQRTGSGVYSATTTLSCVGDDPGEVTIRTPKKTDAPYPERMELAHYAWFERGFPIIYVDQGPDPWDAYSASGSSASLSATVRVKVFTFNVPVLLQVRDKATLGGDFNGDMLDGISTKAELAIALGLEPPPSNVRLTPDVGPGGNRNGFIDIGELVPLDPGWSVGHWQDLPQAAGKTIAVALCGPKAGTSSWEILSFAAFEVATAQLTSKKAMLTGTFVRWLDTGQWSAEKPPGVYIEMPVLTE